MTFNPKRKSLEKLAEMVTICAKTIVLDNQKWKEEAVSRLEEIENEWNRRRSFLPDLIDHERPEFGALRAAGYRAGYYGVEKPIREYIIDRVMIGTIPPVKDRSYVAEWGQPNTRKRFKKNWHRPLERDNR